MGQVCECDCPNAGVGVAPDVDKRRRRGERHRQETKGETDEKVETAASESDYPSDDTKDDVESESESQSQARDPSSTTYDSEDDDTHAVDSTTATFDSTDIPTSEIPPIEIDINSDSVTALSGRSELTPLWPATAIEKRSVTVEQFSELHMSLAQATLEMQLNTIKLKDEGSVGEGRSRSKSKKRRSISFKRSSAKTKRKRTVRLRAVYKISKGTKAKQKHITEWHRSRVFETALVDVRECVDFKLQMAMKESLTSKRKVAGYIKFELSEKSLTGDKVVAYGHVELNDYIDRALIKRNGDLSEHEVVLYDRSLKAAEKRARRKSRKMKSAAMKAVATVRVSLRLKWPADVVQSFHKQFSVQVKAESPLSLMSRRPAKLRLTVLGVMFGTDHMATWKGLALPMLTQSLKEEGTSSKYFDDQLTYVSVRVSHKVKDMREVVLHSTEYNSKDADVVYIGEEFEFDLVPYKRDEGELGFGICHPQEAYELMEETRRTPGCILMDVRKVKRSVACAFVHVHLLVATTALEPGSTRKSEEMLWIEPMYEFVKASSAAELKAKAAKACKSQYGAVFCKYVLHW